MISKSTACLFTFGTFVCFTLGAYYQHKNALERIHALVEQDPYAFHIRAKIYDVLKIFSINYEELETNRKSHSRLQEIMKYGFPGLDDIRTYSDFVISYDRRNRIAHWTYEHLHADCVRNNPNVSRRPVFFQSDMNVPSDFRINAWDYQGSGFDRGHLAAAGNHKCAQTHCNETFNMTNVTPQVGEGFNRDAWNNLEIYVRQLTERYGSVYVCTGPLFKPKCQSNGKWYVEYEVIGPNKTIAVPTHFFKVITIESKLHNGKPYMEAYVIPNAKISNDVNLRTFLTDIRDIERSAGLKFFDGFRRSSLFFGINYTRLSQVFKNFDIAT